MNEIQYPPMYFGAAHQYFLGKLNKADNDEEKKFIASVADDYSNVPTFISYPAVNEGHQSLSNLMNYVMNNVFMDNLLSLESQYNHLKDIGKVDDAIFNKTLKGNFHIQTVIEQMLSNGLEVQNSTLNQDDHLMAQAIFIDKIQAQNKERLNQLQRKKILSESNNSFLESMVV